MKVGKAWGSIIKKCLMKSNVGAGIVRRNCPPAIQDNVHFVVKAVKIAQQLLTQLLKLALG